MGRKEANGRPGQYPNRMKIRERQYCTPEMVEELGGIIAEKIQACCHLLHFSAVPLKREMNFSYQLASLAASWKGTLLF